MNDVVPGYRNQISLGIHVTYIHPSRLKWLISIMTKTLITAQFDFVFDVNGYLQNAFPILPLIILDLRNS